MKSIKSGSIMVAIAMLSGLGAVSHAQDGQPEPVASDAVDQANLKALEARALLETGEFDGAVRVAEEALELDPNNETAAWVLAETGDRDPNTNLDTRIERWSSLAGAISDPDQRSSVLSYVDELRDPLLASISVTGFYFGDGDQDQQYGLRSNFLSASNQGRRFLASLEYRAFVLDAPEPFDLDENLVRGSIGTSIRSGKTEYRGLVEASTDTIGVSGGITRKRAAGDFGARARFNTPYWEITQGVESDLALDELELFAQHFSTYFSGNASASVRKYTIDSRSDFGNAFRASLGGTVSFTADRESPRVSAQYFYEDVFDEEFVPLGSVPRPGDLRPASIIPLRDREVFSAGLYKRYEFLKPPFEAGLSEIDLGLGYRADLTDETDGLFATVNADYDIARNVSLGLTVEYSEVSERQQNADGYLAALITLSRRFGGGT